MVVQKKTWTICFLFKVFFHFFIKLVLGGISQSNHHLLILDGHGSHVLEAIKHASQFGLDMFILLTHTSHALQPLDVNYFKPFKFAFRKKKDNNMVRNNHLELDKVTLASWVDKTHNQSLSKQNILSGFKVTWV
jgi:hypothetical protein